MSKDARAENAALVVVGDWLSSPNGFLSRGEGAGDGLGSGQYSKLAPPTKDHRDAPIQSLPKISSDSVGNIS